MIKGKQAAFTLVEIMIVVVIIGLLAAMAIPAFQKVRQTTQQKAILNNLRQFAGVAQQYMMETGASIVVQGDIIGQGKLIRRPKSVAGENYSTIFPIANDQTSISITAATGDIVTYNF